MASESSIGHMPTSDKWEFDGSVTAVFEDMLERSIPQYKTMRQLVFSIGCDYVHAGSHILDLGCSTGEMLLPFIRKYGNSATYSGVEVSESMLEKCQARFDNYKAPDMYGNEGTPRICIENIDLRRGFPGGTFTLITSVLTLMFIPAEYRQAVLKKAYDRLESGGAFILVEKILGSSSELNSLMVDRYLAMKKEFGYSSEEVERKRLSLEGVLVPMTAKFNEELLRDTGFRQIDCFWRWMNFAGWIAIK